MQNVILHCRYFVSVMKILAKFLRKRLLLIIVQLLLSFTLQLPTLLRHELLQRNFSKILMKGT